MRKIFVFTGFLLAICLSAAGQSNELALTAGVKITPSGTAGAGAPNSVDVDKAFAVEGSFAHDLKSVPMVALQLELPVVAVPTADVPRGSVLSSKSYSSIYFTPGFKLRFGSKLPINPWIAAGAGIAHFNPSSTTQTGTPSGASSTTKGAFEAGGGLDFKATIFPIAFRLEVREFFTGVPNLGIPRLDLHHNIFAGGGIVFRF